LRVSLRTRAVAEKMTERESIPAPAVEAEFASEFATHL
jgi:hypothetical protein